MTESGVAQITGRLVVILTVTDLLRSEAWYQELFGMEAFRYVRPDEQVGQVSLREPVSGLELCLVSHRSSDAEPFDEKRTGLDHVEFVVSGRTDLDEWVIRLNELGIDHSGVKQPSYTANAMVTFRDPDNIQLEFFWVA